MFDRIKEVTRGNILVMILLGAISMVSIPTAIGASWYTYYLQTTIVEAKKEYQPIEASVIHQRNMFVLVSLMMGPCACLSTFFFFKLIFNSTKP